MNLKLALYLHSCFDKITSISKENINPSLKNRKMSMFACLMLHMSIYIHIYNVTYTYL